MLPSWSQFSILLDKKKVRCKSAEKVKKLMKKILKKCILKNRISTLSKVRQKSEVKKTRNSFRMRTFDVVSDLIPLSQRYLSWQDKSIRAA